MDAFDAAGLPERAAANGKTADRVRREGLAGKLETSHNVCLLPPVGYLEFLAILMRCAFVLTDSGGIQEEVTAPNVRKMAFVLRASTERPEAVEAGFAEVVGTRAEDVLGRLREFLTEPWTAPTACPFGDGTAGERIADLLGA